jgi:hypothetical protein
MHARTSDLPAADEEQWNARFQAYYEEGRVPNEC